MKVAAKDLVDEGLKPIVLNMANARTPGGGFHQGDGKGTVLCALMSETGAQEENLHRRSNLSQYLEDPERINPNRGWYYPIKWYARMLYC